MKKLSQNFSMEVYQLRIDVVSNMLRELGFTTAADDVTLDNCNRYAAWVLNEVRNRQVLTDPVTRERTTQPKWEAAEVQLEKVFKELGIEPVATEKWQTSGK